MFIHDALVETIKIGQTEISVTNFRKELAVLTTKDPETDICPLQREFDVSFIKMCFLVTSCNFLLQRLNSYNFPNPSEFGTATLSLNASKNRYPDILPCELVTFELQPLNLL